MLTKSLLEIVIDSTSNFDSSKQQLEITIDKILVPYVIKDNVILIEQDISVGIHLLRIKLTDTAKFKIADFRLDKASIRSALYLSWTEHQGNKSCPDTCLTKIGQTWLLPFGNPLSHWLTMAYNKFNLRGPEYQHGQNIHDVCEVYYPETVDIGPDWPKIVQDFFKYDFDFSVIDKKQNRYQKNLPYIPVDLGSSLHYFTDVYNEIVAAYDFLSSTQSTLPQNQYNILENPDYANHQWTVHHLRDLDKTTGTLHWNSTLNQLPKLKQLIEHLDVVDPFYCFIGVTPAGSYVVPHVDSAFNSKTHLEPYNGCTQLYIPLTPNDKSLFKIASVGLVPNIPVIINNSHYVHSLINNQDCMRVTLALRFNFDKNPRFYPK